MNINTDMQVPAWAKELLPAWVEPFQGAQGIGTPWSDTGQPLGLSVAGLDHWQANHFIAYRPETAAFLYNHYTPTHINYPMGLLPQIEKATANLRNHPRNIHLARKLIAQVLPGLVRHPVLEPKGQWVEPDRALDDQSIIHSGSGWCNEQSRVFVRLCQSLNIPARMVYLFFGNNDGHVSSELYINHQWVHADPSWFILFEDEQGHPMSAAQCHETSQGRSQSSRLIKERMDDVSRTTGSPPPADWYDALDHLFDRFGLLNYPLPVAPDRHPSGHSPRDVLEACHTLQGVL